jgi:hypothetical protein
MKKKHTFDITIQRTTEGGTPETITFSTANHDDIIALMQTKLPDQSDASLSRLLGLKLFGEAMLDDRTNPLYEDMLPAFKTFMQKFKASVAAKN